MIRASGSGKERGGKAMGEQRGRQNIAEQWRRTEMLLGAEALERLFHARVAIFGIGGVGGCAAEALARSGIGAIDLIDSDKVSISNINRQIIATYKTVGRYKTEVMRERILEINPDCEVEIHNCFYLPETQAEFEFRRYSYVVDAVDTVTAKLALILQAQEAGTPVISSMGTGNKLDPTALEVADIYETSVCPLARVMRRELKKRGVKSLKVVYSREEPKPSAPQEPAGGPAETMPQEGADRPAEIMHYEPAGGPATMPQEPAGRPVSGKRAVPGSVAFVPPAAGLILAAEVVKDLIGGNRQP